MSSIKVIDLFCGIGGLSHGFVREGFEVAAGFDIDETCRFPFETNNNALFVNKDIREVKGSELSAFFGKADVRILVGCAPCQPFSTYAFKSPDKQEDAQKAKWSLLGEFARLIEEIKPEIVSMENVPGLAKFDKSYIFQDFLKVLDKNDYFIDFKEIYCPDYGIPQQRKRLVLLASRLSPIKIMDKTHSPKTYKTVKDAIGDLEPIESGGISEKDPIHRASKLSDKNIQRIRQSKQGGTWRDWSEDLVLDCHRKTSGKSYGSVYGRMDWDKPSPTMTTFCTGIGNGRFGHPEQDRAISLREAALLQTFPKTYKFVPDGQTPNTTRLSTHIGNAVPVELGQVVAKSIKFHLAQWHKTYS
ncbi:DNA cytosine methyltransferase [Runella aurantiaca]|uniref:DNA (cytosine-5-)-methyltransferase n=1 Tax=Runella aurantiaca TaxID=2282308 RepID=A0A369IE94_9BACT|nr:DNA (cytosine-5-)-methyltransferase [Runella aurantiaca]RDB07170.1 DNA (cytosine-5-)-methyltransferase [Runella aurantiaca]